ncbi:MAG TPA: hypothetical protein VJM50_24055 [Pyrinomonadaceae bacterium]|nr:hypothetical protein [Pyrinomonadaceae bacterium]
MSNHEFNAAENRVMENIMTSKMRNRDTIRAGIAVVVESGVYRAALRDADVGMMSLAVICHGLADRSGWWSDPRTGEPVDRNDGEMFALIHSEISEALEGVRKGCNDRHLPHRKAVEVELADALIRIFDYAGSRGLDLGSAMIEKLAYNQQRADHKREARVAEGGKKF